MRPRGWVARRDCRTKKNWVLTGGLALHLPPVGGFPPLHSFVAFGRRLDDRIHRVKEPTRANFCFLMRPF